MLMRKLRTKLSRTRASDWFHAARTTGMLCTEAGPGPDAMAAPMTVQLRWRAVLLLLLSHLVAAQPPDPAWPEPGTACAVRQLAHSFAMRQLAAAGPIAAADASTRLARTLALGTNSSGLPPPNDGLCAVPAESLARNSGLTPETAEQQSSFFVSMQGNDSADGTTLASAFRTLQRARDAARKTGGPSSVLVAGGVYFQSAQPLRLGQVDSGTTLATRVYNNTAIASSGQFYACVRSPSELDFPRIHSNRFFVKPLANGSLPFRPLCPPFAVGSLQAWQSNLPGLDAGSTIESGSPPHMTTVDIISQARSILGLVPL